MIGQLANISEKPAARKLYYLQKRATNHDCNPSYTQEGYTRKYSRGRHPHDTLQDEGGRIERGPTIKGPLPKRTQKGLDRAVGEGA